MTATILLILLLAACTVSCSFWLVALGCLRSALKRPKRHGAERYEPSVSILKPVKGIDAGALENFASFCAQAYPQFEVLFGVADLKDPAVPLIEPLRTKFPSLSIRLLVSEPLGTNPKAATLHCLAAEAAGEILAICDADIRVGPDFLRRVVAPLVDPKVGLVTCLYRGEMPRNISARLEALHMDAAFAPSVALAWKHGTKVGLGAAVIMRRADLARAGGYAGIADHLLDDYEIAARIARLGLGIHLSDYPVASVLGAMHFPQQWAREVRWARGIRVVRPLQYPGMIITFSLPLALAAAAFFPLTPWALAAVPGVLAVRWFVAWRSAVLLGQRERTYLAWLPVRDLLSFAVWLAAMFGRRVKWRGQAFALGRDGRLQAIEPDALPDGLLARGIRRLDARLRRKQGIFEFCDDERCVLRVNVAPAEAEMRFDDGTVVRAGEPVGVLHLWNEHLATIPRDGADLAWAVAMSKRMQRSLRELARAARHDPRLRGVQAFGGTGVFVSRAGVSQVAKMASRFGFEWMPSGHKTTLFGRIHDFFENFLVLGLQWAFNPGGLRGKGFIRPREPLWMSRETLMKRYQAAPKRKPEQLEPVAADGCGVDSPFAATRQRSASRTRSAGASRLTGCMYRHETVTSCIGFDSRSLMILLGLSIVWVLVVAGLLARAIGQYQHFRVLRPASPDAADERAPSVTVIVPARNEEANIGRCLAGLVAQDYPRDQLRVVVVDDNSEDRTGAIARDAAQAHDRIEVLAGGPLPAGWLGKPHACAQAVARATGEWLCFLDADIVAEPPAIRTAMRTALSDGLELLSLQPQQDLRTVAERMTVPAGFFLIAFTQDLRRTNDPASPDASVDGQFMLIRRAVYEATGGHAAVRDAIAEDSELAKRIKSAGHKLAVFGTEGLLRARMYDNVRSLREGLARQAASLLGGAPALLVAAACALALVCAAVLLPARAGYEVASRPDGIAIAALCCSAAGSLALLGTHVGAARYFRMPFWYGLLYPLQYLLGAVLLAYAAWLRTNRRTRWKGRVYDEPGTVGAAGLAAHPMHTDRAPIP